MFPFGNDPHNNYIPDPYPQPGLYPNHLYYVPEAIAEMFSHGPDPEKQEYPFQNPFQSDYRPFYEEFPVKIEQRETKPSQLLPKEENKDDNQFSVSDYHEEYQQPSPQLRFKQKYGRNTNSNIFIYMVRRLLVQQKLREKIKKLFARENSLLSQQQFMSLLAKKQEKLPTYVGFQKMKKMFQGQKYRNRIYQETLIKQREFCKFFRIICRYYLKNMHILHAYNVIKMNLSAKKIHVISSRRILDQMNPN